MAKLKRFGGTPVSEGVRLEVGKYTIFAVRNSARDISVRMRREPRKLLKVCMQVPFLRGATRLIRDIMRFLDGLGEAAARNLYDQADVNDPYISCDELQQRTGITKAVLQSLKDLGVVEGLPDTSQMTFF